MASGSSEGDSRRGTGALVLVVGASGVGKDTILAGGRTHASREKGYRCVCPRMHHRPAHASEDFQSMTRDEFERAAGQARSR